MSNNSNPNYFRLGVFVLAAIAVLISVILILALDNCLRDPFMLRRVSSNRLLA